MYLGNSFETQAKLVADCNCVHLRSGHAASVRASDPICADLNWESADFLVCHLGGDCRNVIADQVQEWMSGPDSPLPKEKFRLVWQAGDMSPF